MLETPKHREYGVTLFPDGTAQFSRELGRCVCGHGIDCHPHSQWRTHWPCEHPDCECVDYEEERAK